MATSNSNLRKTEQAPGGVCSQLFSVMLALVVRCIGLAQQLLNQIPIEPHEFCLLFFSGLPKKLQTHNLLPPKFPDEPSDLSQFFDETGELLHRSLADEFDEVLEPSLACLATELQSDLKEQVYACMEDDVDHELFCSMQDDLLELCRGTEM
mmetsp:Transcript_51270/g.81355  ORF Transcript_51270/g.81355 Transcript_51270/m.81355 type:complete len:152 (-) Transcript_51270:231-686(-)